MWPFDEFYSTSQLLWLRSVPLFKELQQLIDRQQAWHWVLWNSSKGHMFSRKIWFSPKAPSNSKKMPKSYLLVRFWWISVAGYCRNNSGKCAGGPALTIQDGCLATKALSTVPPICPEPAEQDFFCCCLIWTCDRRQPIREQYQFWSQLTPA